MKLCQNRMAKCVSVKKKHFPSETTLNVMIPTEESKVKLNKIKSGLLKIDVS
jgi:hypothetical protein